ncbi:hypothetical protein R3P38DRAFT_2889557 [Favolaschia claudopus]|uniref:Uncharacterized protein n=1 Tax=Favolaschia claudopus TaxID=2862362 RepID=A0AAW0CW58_9AGAR
MENDSDMFRVYLTSHLQVATIWSQPDFATHLVGLEFTQNPSHKQLFQYRTQGESFLINFISDYVIESDIPWIHFPTIKSTVLCPRTARFLLLRHWKVLNESDALDLLFLFLGRMRSRSETEAANWMSRVFGFLIDSIVMGCDAYLRDADAVPVSRKEDKHSTRANHLSTSRNFFHLAIACVVLTFPAVATLLSPDPPTLPRKSSTQSPPDLTHHQESSEPGIVMNEADPHPCRSSVAQDLSSSGSLEAHQPGQSQRDDELIKAVPASDICEAVSYQDPSFEGDVFDDLFEEGEDQLGFDGDGEAEPESMEPVSAADEEQVESVVDLVNDSRLEPVAPEDHVLDEPEDDVLFDDAFDQAEGALVEVSSDLESPQAQTGVATSQWPEYGAFDNDTCSKAVPPPRHCLFKKAHRVLSSSPHTHYRFRALAKKLGAVLVGPHRHQLLAASISNHRFLYSNTSRVGRYKLHLPRTSFKAAARRARIYARLTV